MAGPRRLELLDERAQPAGASLRYVQPFWFLIGIRNLCFAAFFAESLALRRTVDKSKSDVRFPVPGGGAFSMPARYRDEIQDGGPLYTCRDTLPEQARGRGSVAGVLKCALGIR